MFENSHLLDEITVSVSYKIVATELIHSKFLILPGTLHHYEGSILTSQVVSLPLQSVMEVANFCAAMDTLIDPDVKAGAALNKRFAQHVYLQPAAGASVCHPIHLTRFSYSISFYVFT